MRDTFINLSIRYKTEDSKSGFEYGYSPCRSLSWGPAGIGDCHDGDVAVRDQ